MAKLKKYEKYKNANINWIDFIPEHWNINALFQLFNQVKQKNTNLKENNLLSLSYGKLKRKNIETTEGLLPISFEGYNIIKQNDIVLRLTDLQNDHKSLRVGYANENGIITSAYVTIRNRSLNLSKYLYYYLHSFDIAKGFYGMGAGVRQGLNYNGLKYLDIALPPTIEQEKIVKFVEYKEKQINNIINRQKKIIKLLEEKKNITITKVITKGLNKNVSLKDSKVEWIGKIPNHWNVNALFQLFVQVKNKNHGLKEKNLLSLSYGKLKRKNINTTEGLLPTNFEGYNIIKQGDIVLRLTDLQNDQKSLRVGHSDEKGIITSAYVTIRNRSLNLSKYLYYYLHSFDIAKGFYGMGAGVRQGLNFNELKYLNIVLPPVKEQEKIVEFLDKTIVNIDNIIEQKKSLIEKLEEYKKILISNAVTGQINIRDYEIKKIVEENIIEDDIEEQLEDEELNEVEYANN